jgi:GT2 family glycosyltransferase
MIKNKVDLSIIIVSWNVKKYLKTCLNSIYKKDLGLTLEVYVVDNASSDESAGMVKTEFPQVILVENKTNVGFAAANNQALRESKGQYILLLNPDCILLNGTIRKMYDFMENHPDVGASGGRILNPEGEVEPFRSAKRFPTPLSKFFVDIHLDRIFLWPLFFGKYSIAGWDRDDVKEVEVLSGAFMFVRRETVEEVGILDERFFLLAEDIDWCRRIKQKNWKILFNPDAEIMHYGGKSIDQAKQTRLRHEIYSHSLYFKKHHGRFVSIQYRALSALTNLLKTNYWMMKYILGNDRKIALINVKAHFHAIFYSLSFSSGIIGH